MTVRAVAGEAALLAAGSVSIALAPVHAPERRLPAAAAIAVGAAGGAVLFGLLARTVVPPPLGAAVAVAAVVLVPRAAAEEGIWRWGALLLLAPALGRSGAVGLSAAAFALAHGLRGAPRALAVRGGVGASFGVLFLATGCLAAAVAAHAVYNVLAVAAALGWEDAAT